MTIRNLNFMFNPSSIALVGASQEPGSIGAVLARNLVTAGFNGAIFPVSPKDSTIEGLPAYPDLDSLPKAPDLAVIAAPPETVPQLIEKLGSLGTRAAVVITAGFLEGGREEGQRLYDRMLDSARPHLLRIMGPNSLGVMVPGVGLNAGLGHVQPLKGNIAFVTQSGGIRATVLDWATSKGIGFSHIVSMGDMSDIDFGDMLDYLATDFKTKAILLYIETVTHIRKFMSAARAAARMKPVVVVKPGRHSESARAVAFHTGILTGADEVYNAAFERAGMLRVMDMQALFDALETLAMSRSFSGDRLAILTNGGGMGMMATDVLIDKKGRLAELSPETISRLNKVLPAAWSHSNPVDIVGDAPPGRYADALNTLLEDKGVDALLIINCPSSVSSGEDTARAVVNTLKESGSKASSRGIFTCWLGVDSAREARKILAENGIPTYATPAEAVRGFMQMVRYRISKKMLMETPANIPEIFEPEMEKAKEIVNNTLSQGREWLTKTEALAIISAYKIPVAQTDESPAMEYSTVGRDRLGASLPEMVHRPNTRKLIIRVGNDVQFGPVILFGEGGAAVDIIQDKAIALPPLNMQLAKEEMRKTRVFRLLEEYGVMPAADLDSIALTLVKVSQLVCDIEDIVEMDINPLLADEQGVLALDARIRVSKSHLPSAQRLAICPFPKELEEVIPLPDGQTLLLRPIRPEDEPMFQELFSRLTKDEIRLRFLHAVQFLSHEMAAFLTQIDYDREMALILCEPSVQKKPAMYGMVRLSADPDNAHAEFDILIRNDMTGMGLGPLLMRRIIDYARNRGIGEIFGEVLAENRSMLRLCEAFGFKKRRDPEDPGVMIVSLML
ncbi:MAG: GNAT family N-acetyltransferase [Desulfobulbaceae bacterium]|nr:GNAT family N-acetyltransferase [Desulfobulbaceae bacterium]